MAITNQQILDRVNAVPSIRQAIVTGATAQALNELKAVVPGEFGTEKKRLDQRDLNAIIGLAKGAFLMSQLRKVIVTTWESVKLAVNSEGPGMPSDQSLATAEGYQQVIDLLQIGKGGVDFTHPETQKFLTQMETLGLLAPDDVMAIMTEAAYPLTQDVKLWGEPLTKERFQEFIRWLKPRFNMVPSGPVKVPSNVPNGTTVWDVSANTVDPAGRKLTFSIINQTVLGALSLSTDGKLQVANNATFPDKVGVGTDKDRVAARVLVTNTESMTADLTVTLDIINP